MRAGLGLTASASLKPADWDSLKALALQHGLLTIMVDGVDKVPLDLRPSKAILLELIGLSMRDEQQHDLQWKSTCEFAKVLAKEDIKTYVLKGEVVAECYPIPNHRTSADFDCFLLPLKGDFDACEKANCLMEERGYEAKRGYYKNSTIVLPYLIVENHRFLTPFRGNNKLKALEILLQSMMRNDKGDDIMENTTLYRPPVMVTALFLIEHAYSHFLHEGLTWRHILDWALFKKKHYNQIAWSEFNGFIDEFGFRAFYESYERLGQFLIGEVLYDELTDKDRRMLSDVWAPLDLHETLHGLKAKFQLAGNTWRARWKYRDFSSISWLKSLCTQVFGFFFIKHPIL